VIHRSLTQLTAIVMVGLGVTMLGITVAEGGGVGLLIGPLFVAAGTARLWMLRKRR
jgi:hypothetical protein